MTTEQLSQLKSLLVLALDDPMAAKIVIGKKRVGTDLVRALDAVQDELEARS